MPSYTHLQRAEPVLVAHWLLSYVSMIERDISRLTDARKRMNFSPLGSGAIAGATLALDRNIAAAALTSTPQPPTAWTLPPTATSPSSSLRPSPSSASTSPASPKSSLSTPLQSSVFSTFPKPSPLAQVQCRRRKTPTSPNSSAANPAASSAQRPHSLPSSKASPSPTTKTSRRARSQSSTPPKPRRHLQCPLRFHRIPQVPLRQNAHRRGNRLPQRHGRRHLPL